MAKSTKPKIKGAIPHYPTQISTKSSQDVTICPGLGIRYRFNPGLAARGKLVGKTVPLGSDPSASIPSSQIPQIRWTPEVMGQSKRSGATKRVLRHSLASQASVSSENVLDLLEVQNPKPDEGAFINRATQDLDDLNATDHQSRFASRAIFTEPASHGIMTTKNVLKGSGCLVHSLETHDSMTRMLFSNFSETVASGMAIFDGPYNKYRSILLPLAAGDELVRNALLAASAHQLGSKKPEFAKMGLKFQAAAISCLVQASTTGARTIAILAALVLLLVNDLVSAGNNYKILQRLWHSFQATLGGHFTASEDILVDFLRKQWQIMELFMQPFLGEEIAVLNLSTRFADQIQFITQEVVQYPEYAEAAELIQSAHDQACDLYLHRAINNVPVEKTATLVQQLQDTIEPVAQGSPGEHGLVWVYFIAAAESSTQSHRDFFRNRLLHIYNRIGFSNILHSFKILDGIWQDSDSRWTNVIMQLEQVFVF
ncbi:hypothetical protein BP5796_01364 [Coleophoma crateriformis]|uniref:Uncharacterized protein n=1 Tax=Coleophoma crateriformis TaxID=565419 RepID=A0A3D8T0B6_9HELO|nr:hypothetical protein BP5796_01364 [Coleophoma crateriformis]